MLAEHPYHLTSHHVPNQYLEVAHDLVVVQGVPSTHPLSHHPLLCEAERDLELMKKPWLMMERLVAEQKLCTLLHCSGTLTPYSNCTPESMVLNAFGTISSLYCRRKFK